MKIKILLIILAISLTALSQTVINVGIGPSFHGNYQTNGGKVPWNATIEAGRIFDKILGFGLDLDFTWAVMDSFDVQNDSISTRAGKNKLFMFPLSVAMFVDPIAKFKLHPVIRGQFGVNIMVRDLEDIDSTGNITTSIKDGFYIGFIGKGAIDAVFDIGQHAAIFAGFEYQAGRLRHKIDDNEYTYYDLNAPGIRMGLSFLF